MDKGWRGWMETGYNTVANCAEPKRNRIARYTIEVNRSKPKPNRTATPMVIVSIVSSSESERERERD